MSRVERRPFGRLIAVSRVAPRAARRALLIAACPIGGYSITARLQHQPASSRATATATIVERFPRSPSSRCQRRCRRRAATSARAQTAAGCPARRAEQRLALAQRAAVVPSRLDEQPAGVLISGLRDRALPTAAAGRLLGDDEAQKRADRAAVESLPVTDLDAQPERCQHAHPTQTAEPTDGRGKRLLTSDLDDRPVERVASAAAASRHTLRRTPAATLARQSAAAAATHRAPPTTPRRHPTRARDAAATSTRDGGYASSPSAPSSRARTRSRAASSTSVGTRTACRSPTRKSRTNRSASRRSVLTRSPDARAIRLGAATTHAIPDISHARARPYPVGPASYATRTGLSSVNSHSTIRSVRAAHASTEAHPSPRRARTPRPTGHAHPTRSSYRHPSGASRKCGSTAAPTATATRANLRAEAPGHYIRSRRPGRRRPSAARGGCARRPSRTPT